MKTPGIQEVARALLTARRDAVVCDAAALAGALHDPADAFAVLHASLWSSSIWRATYSSEPPSTVLQHTLTSAIY